MNIVLRSVSVLSLVSVALAASAQNIVQDPGFESAAGTPGAATSYASGQSIDGGAWTVGAPPSGTFDFFAVDKDPVYVISGTTSAFLGGSSLSQTLATSTGSSYLVSFDAYSYDAPTVPLVVDFGASTYSFKITSKHVSFLTSASSPSTVLRFGTPSLNRFELDNVSVVANPTPEPTALAALGLGAVAMLRRRKRA